MADRPVAHLPDYFAVGSLEAAATMDGHTEAFLDLKPWLASRLHPAFDAAMLVIDHHACTQRLGLTERARAVRLLSAQAEKVAILLEIVAAPRSPVNASAAVARRRG